MKANEIVSDDAQPAVTDDLFEMANLFPRDDGVGRSARKCAARRAKVNMSHGNQMSPANTAVVGIAPSPRVIAGRLSPDDRRAVFEWVSLNDVPLAAYWEGQIDTIELGQRLKPLPSTRPGAPGIP
jgi:hypothetical protein